MPEVARLLGLEMPPPPTSADSGENISGQANASPIRAIVGSTARREMLSFGEELTEEEQLVRPALSALSYHSRSMQASWRSSKPPPSRIARERFHLEEAGLLMYVQCTARS